MQVHGDPAELMLVMLLAHSCAGLGVEMGARDFDLAFLAKHEEVGSHENAC